MDSVDLEITPVERAVRIVVVYFAGAPRVFGPLYGESDYTQRAVDCLLHCLLKTDV